MDHYPEATEAGRILRSLEGSDADSDLAALSDLTEVDHRQRDRLRAAIAAAAASTSTADAAAATRDADEARALVARLAELANRVAPPEVALLRAAAAAHSESRKAAELAAEQLQGPVDGVGGGPWRLMWEAARSFVAAPGAPFPPPRGSHCPLCLQVVDEVTAERLLHLDKHIKSTVSAAAAAHAAAWEAAVARVSPTHAEGLRASPFVLGLRQRDTSLAGRVDRALDELTARLSAVVKDPMHPSDEVQQTDLGGVIDALTGWADARAQHAAILRAADDPQALAGMTHELAELDARARLGVELDAFEAWRESVRVMRALDAAHSAWIHRVGF